METETQPARPVKLTNRQLDSLIVASALALAVHEVTGYGQRTALVAAQDKLVCERSRRRR